MVLYTYLKFIIRNGQLLKKICFLTTNLLFLFSIISFFFYTYRDYSNLKTNLHLDEVLHNNCFYYNYVVHVPLFLFLFLYGWIAGGWEAHFCNYRHFVSQSLVSTLDWLPNFPHKTWVDPDEGSFTWQVNRRERESNRDPRRNFHWYNLLRLGRFTGMRN